MPSSRSSSGIVVSALRCSSVVTPRARAVGHRRPSRARHALGGIPTCPAAVFSAMRPFALAADALATPALRRLQLAWALVGMGGWGFMVVLAVHAYSVGGAAAVGLATLARMLPAGVLAPLLGLAADRLPRRDVLLAAAGARALVLAGWPRPWPATLRSRWPSR